MKPVVMMIKTRMPSEKSMKYRFENPSDSTDDRAEKSEEQADEATDQTNCQPK